MASLTHEIDMPRINITLTIRLGLGYRLRSAVSVAIIKLASWIMPHNVEVIVETQPK